MRARRPVGGRRRARAAPRSRPTAPRWRSAPPSAIEFAPASGLGGTARRHATPGPVERVVWSDDGGFLAASCGEAGLALVGLSDGRFGAIGGFPAPPRSIAFSGPADALVASGAHRIAAWDLDRPPFDGDRSGALETGRAGMVAVVAVAAHPRRRLVAAGYANGQIAVAEIGRRDELILKPSGPAPAALAWSADGRMLAIAAEDGVSLVTLPDALFKTS